MKIIDLHCDLLSCIAESPQQLNFVSPETNCSLPQLEEGQVILQVFAIAVINPKNSTKFSLEQVNLYKRLLRDYPQRVAPSKTFSLDTPCLHGIFAIENALGLVEEDEPLEKAFKRFEDIEKIEKILYVSLTWNQENRFGGGNTTSIGLKRDGQLFLEFLAEKNTAIDLSHTSDALAYDILNYIHRKSLPLKVMASHSNFRKVQNVPRNLPDEVACEIIDLGGVIGMNFIRRFVGDDKEAFCHHIEHALALHGETNLCLGSDFYGGITIPSDLIPGRSFPIFQEGFSNSSCFPYFIQLLEPHFPHYVIENICWRNAFHFIKNLY